MGSDAELIWCPLCGEKRDTLTIRAHVAECPGLQAEIVKRWRAQQRGTEWMEKAACGGSQLGDWFDDDSASDTWELGLRRQTCFECPVRRECTDWAFASPASTEEGVYGGVTGRERKRVEDLPPDLRYKALTNVLKGKLGKGRSTANGQERTA